MGLDGFSMGNLGLNTDLTSAQMANQADHLAQKGSEFRIKDITQTAEDTGIKWREENKENNQQFQKNKKKQEEDENSQEQRTDEEQNVLSSYATSEAIRTLVSASEFESKDPKDFSLRLTRGSDVIELYNNKNGQVVETIKAEELMELMAKLHNPAGILVNRKI